MRIVTLLFRTAAILLPALALSPGLRAQQLDPSFHPPVLTVPAGVTGPFVSKVVRQADGRYLIAGSFQSVDGHVTMGLARLLPDGHVDPTFVYRPTYSYQANYPTQIGVQSSGAVIVANFDEHLLRLLPSGQIDPTFRAALLPRPDSHWFDRLLVQPDDKIVLAGATTDSLGRNGLVRLLANGRVDTGFSPPVQDGYRSWYDVALEPSGRLIFTYIRYQANTPPLGVVWRLLSSGQLDPTFTFTAGQTLTNVSRVTICPDGSYALGGSFTGKAVIRLLPSGAVDNAFAASLYLQACVCYPALPRYTTALAVQPDSRILAAGRFYTDPQPENASLLRTLPQGGQDASFDYHFFYSPNSIPGYNGAQINDLLMEPSGKLLVGGQFTQAGGVPHYGLARLLAATPLATTPGAEPEPLRVWPVPAHGQLSVQLPAGKAARQLTLLDATGRVALRVESPAAGELRLPTATLPAGFYVLRVSYADGSSQGRRVALE